MVNLIILITSVLVYVIVAVLARIQTSDEHFPLLRAIAMMSIGAGLMSIITYFY